MTGDEWRDRVGRRIEAARVAKRLSARKAAIAAGVSDALWRQIESGTRQVAQDIKVAVNPRDSTLEAVAQAVDLDPAEVFAWAGRSYDTPVLATRELPDGRRITAAAEYLAGLDAVAIDALIRALEALRPDDLDDK